MSTVRRRLPLIALSALVPLAAFACGGSEQPKSSMPDLADAPPTSAAPANSVTTTAAGTAAAASYGDAESAFQAGRYEEAVGLFTAYTERRPENVWGHYMLGLAAWRAGDLGRAEAAFDTALALDPHHTKSLLNSSRVLLERGRPAEALERIKTAIEIDTAASEGLRLLGRAQYSLGQVDAAIDAYRRALVVSERDVWAMNNLGLIYIEQGRADDALPPLARAAQLRSNAPVFQNNLGIALERTGRYAAAKRAFEAALASDSTYGKATASLARVSAQSDTATAEPVELAALADEFKLQVQMWRDSMQPPRDTSETHDSASTDSMSTDSISTDSVEASSRDSQE